MFLVGVSSWRSAVTPRDRCIRTVPASIASCLAMVAVSRSRKMRSAITSRCRAGSRHSAVSKVASRPLAEVAGSRQVVVSQGQFAAAPPPPRRPGVQRGAHHPRPRSRMAADLPPRHPGSGERLRHLVFGQLRAADDRHHRPQAGLPARLEELRELRLARCSQPFNSDSPPICIPPSRNLPESRTTFVTWGPDRAGAGSAPAAAALAAGG